MVLTLLPRLFELGEMRTDFGRTVLAQGGPAERASDAGWLGPKTRMAMVAPYRRIEPDRSAGRYRPIERCGRNGGVHVRHGRSVLIAARLSTASNPEQLFVGTFSDNSRDCLLKFTHSRKNLSSRKERARKSGSAVCGRVSASVAPGPLNLGSHVSRIERRSGHIYQRSEPCIQDPAAGECSRRADRCRGASQSRNEQR